MINRVLSKRQPLRVAINAQFNPNRGAGGVGNVLIGLIRALGQLNDGLEEYIIIGPWEESDWLKPYTGPNQRIVPGPTPPQPQAWKPTLKQALGPLRPIIGQLWRNLFPLPRVPVSDGFYENLGCEVIHFPYQHFVACALPSIYNPHDLQHLHYPQFFTPSAIARRETMYPAGCQSAHTIAVASQWVKQDIIRHYPIHPEKIQVIPWAPPTQSYPEPTSETLAVIQAKYQLDNGFALYPAVTWQHKNHIRLVEALALLRDTDSLKIPLVCTGHQNAFWPFIEKRLLELKLQQQVKFLGIVPPEDLRALYRLAQFVVIPTLFEAASGPLFEAWHDGVPVTCSTVTSLPEQAGDAALFFDPLSVEAIANTIAQLATNPKLREKLRQRGTKRLQDFSWERTAKAYRAVYRRAAGHLLSGEDQWLLSWDWMQEPQNKRRL